MSLPTKPQRIQRKRTKGFRLHDHSIALNGLPVVYVGRGSKSTPITQLYIHTVITTKVP